MADHLAHVPVDVMEDHLWPLLNLRDFRAMAYACRALRATVGPDPRGFQRPVRTIVHVKMYGRRRVVATGWLLGGLRHGEWRNYQFDHKQRSIRVVGWYVYGKPHGKHRYPGRVEWYDAGQLIPTERVRSRRGGWVEQPTRRPEPAGGVLCREAEGRRELWLPDR